MSPTTTWRPNLLPFLRLLDVGTKGQEHCHPPPRKTASRNKTRVRILLRRSHFQSLRPQSALQFQIHTAVTSRPIQTWQLVLANRRLVPAHQSPDDSLQDENAHSQTEVVQSRFPKMTMILLPTTTTKTLSTSINVRVSLITFQEPVPEISHTDVDVLM